MNNVKKSISKERNLKHVKVYDHLYSMIKDGAFPAGSQLPSEPDLAVQMDVSRMTLRKALSLLREDGLIQNIQGKGNFVIDYSQIPPSHSPETIQHPLKACCTIKYDYVECEFRIEPPSDYMKGMVKRDTAVIVIADRWYKNGEDAFGYSLSFLPIETISKYKVDLAKKDALQIFLEETMYSISSDSETAYSYTNTGNFTSSRYTLSNQSKFILITETLYGRDGFVLMFSKYYIPLQSFNLTVYRNAQKEQ